MDKEYNAQWARYYGFPKISPKASRNLTAMIRTQSATLKPFKRFMMSYKNQSRKVATPRPSTEDQR